MCVDQGKRIKEHNFEFRVPFYSLLHNGIIFTLLHGFLHLERFLVSDIYVDGDGDNCR